MCRLFAIMLLISIPVLMWGQDGGEKKFLRLGDGFMKKEYFIGHQEVSKEQFTTAMSSDGAAYMKWKAGSTTKALGDVTGGVGVGLWLGGAIAAAGTEDEVTRGVYGTVAGIGLGVTVLGAIISNAGKRKRDKAVSLFNINAAAGADGVGMVISF